MASSESHEIELTGLFAQLLGVWYPRNYVVAAIDAAEGPKAVNDLLSAGFGSNSVYLRDSGRVSEILRRSTNSVRRWSGPAQHSPVRLPTRES